MEGAIYPFEKVGSNLSFWICESEIKKICFENRRRTRIATFTKGHWSQRQKQASSMWNQIKQNLKTQKPRSQIVIPCGLRKWKDINSVGIREDRERWSFLHWVDSFFFLFSSFLAFQLQKPQQQQREQLNREGPGLYSQEPEEDALHSKISHSLSLKCQS